MKTKENQKKFDEIIFSGRNKDYGAYKIRHDYPGNLTKAFTITITACLLGVTVPLIASYYSNNAIVKPGTEITVTIERPDDFNNDEVKPPELPDEFSKQQLEYLEPEVVPASEIDTNMVPWEGNPGVGNLPLDTTFSDIPEPLKPAEIEPPAETKIHTFVDEYPSFIGGEEERMKFLKENTVYPQLAKQNGIEGTVYLNFVVDENGNISNVNVLRGIGSGCDEEAIRVMKMMPAWNPGKTNGHKVKVSFMMPFKFKLLN